MQIYVTKLEVTQSIHLYFHKEVSHLDVCPNNGTWNPEKEQKLKSTLSIQLYVKIESSSGSLKIYHQKFSFLR